MRIYLRTRGRVRDYQFIGLAPEETWWRLYDRVTDLELPAVLMESDGLGWRAYVSGLQSGRRDRVGRPIFMDLVLAGEQGDPDVDDRKLALAIIAGSLGDGGGDGPYDASGREAWGRLRSERLDAVLTEEVVEEWLAEPTLSAWQHAAEAIRAVFRDLPVPSAADEPPIAGHWVGGLGSARSRVAFLGLTGRLLGGGGAGRALTLSYVTDLRDIGGIPAIVGPGAGEPGDGELGVLAAGHGPLFRADPAKLAG